MFFCAIGQEREEESGVKLDRSWEKDGYILRPAREEDAERCFEQNFNPLDREAARLTGCKASFTREEVVSFLRKALHAEDQLSLPADFTRRPHDRRERI